MSDPIVKEFKDGTFSFWAAWDIRRAVIYRVRDDSEPMKRFEEKGNPGFERGETIAFRPATENEVELWLDEHPEYPPIYRDGQTFEEYIEAYGDHQYDDVDFGGDEQE